MRTHNMLVWVVLAALIVGCSIPFPRTALSESSGSVNGIDDLQQDVAAEIAGNSYASGDVAFSVSSARQVLAVDLRNFQPLENTR